MKDISEILNDYFDESLSTEYRDRDFCQLIRSFYILKAALDEADEIISDVTSNPYDVANDDDFFKDIEERHSSLIKSTSAVEKSMESWPYKKELKDLLKHIRSDLG